MTLSLQEPLEADGQLTLADTLPDESRYGGRLREPRRRRPAARAGGCSARPGTRYYAAAVWIDGAPKTQQQTAQALHISRSYVSRLEKRALEYLRGRWPAE